MNRSRYLGRARRLARRQTQWVRDTALDPTPELSAALDAFAAEAEPARADEPPREDDQAA